MVNMFTRKKAIEHKKNILYQLLLEDCNDTTSCDEALNILVDLFKNADLTLIKQTSIDTKVIATTLNNSDNIHALVSTAQYYLTAGKKSLSNRLHVKARPDVLMTKPIMLVKEKECSLYLFIDFYEHDELENDSTYLDELLKLLSLIAKISIFDEERRLSYKIDSLTRLFTRDSLISDIKSIPEEKTCHLAILYISNGTALNKEKGHDFTDELLVELAKLLQKSVEERVYRIGGMKFAVLIKKELQESVFIMQSILDRISDIHAEINSSVMIVPILDDAYKTVYSGERYLKELDVNTVTVFRKQFFDDSDDFMRFSEVIMPRDSDLTYVDEVIERNQKAFSVFEDEIDVVDAQENNKFIYEAEDEEDEEDLVLTLD